MNTYPKRDVLLVGDKNMVDAKDITDMHYRFDGHRKVAFGRCNGDTVFNRTPNLATGWCRASASTERAWMAAAREAI